MAGKGNRVVISAPSHGKRYRGKISGTPKPGTIMQIDASEISADDMLTFEVYNADADGGRPKGPFFVLEEDLLQGKTMDDAYADGDQGWLYIPQAGDQLNLRLADVAGTADDHTKGEMLIVNDTDGKLIATTGTPETEVAMLMETITDPTADTIAWCIWTGY